MATQTHTVATDALATLGTIIDEAAGRDAIHLDYSAGVVEDYGDHHQWDADEYLHFNGRDAHGEIPDEFWTHLEIATGKKPPHKPKYFSCSC